MRSGGDVRSFFRQQKAHAAGGVKPTGGVSKKAALPRHHHKPASQATPDRAVDDARRHVEEAEEEEGRERMAREFDMDMRYGPCLGLTRAQRWRRAAALGLAPPPAVIAVCSDDQPCLWEGRV
ncbi:uncharacterized protein [Oryza sativa Japonica Group]|uniref:Os08g0163300 protein n=3 Tax=Oryza TaxID=4527 RepID=Q0J7T7_ORYSJ|nr:DNA polymerase delta subunit 4 [Oryza sativa Japonica Group]XP_052165870.1 uncharacterized protein LOC127782640 [Oryza glaberrima]EEC82949.1 hypothetical protein OsI_27932 [Oryza sativa Indica Group]KAF2918235.1 hypothetical protein DAI22_08g042700 [Oryza sativa Japonica Group]BAF22978.2 Os08g0163300 [Oryza sativa Japonica Group]|eukprot:NP_001061064.2 Os08g0163300 [Oryza sativa Japonica Group]